MLSYRYIDRPTAIPRHFYEEAIDEIIKSNKNLDGIKAIYKFGNITSPGISDLDLLFVFHDGSSCVSTGFEFLQEKHKPIFTHGIMAISDQHFAENSYYTLWSDHQLLWGEASSQEIKIRTGAEENALSIQTAVEFLIANYIDIKIQRCYKVIKLRAFLQHMKGLLYDLSLLKDDEHPIHLPLIALKKWILEWFTTTPSDRDLNQWIDAFEPLYDNYVNGILQKSALYLPAMDRYPISRNMLLTHKNNVTFNRKGILLPVQLAVIGRKYFKLQHRLNNFAFTCPITATAAPIVTERYAFLQRMKAYNRKHLPNFMTITTSITAKLI